MQSTIKWIFLLLAVAVLGSGCERHVSESSAPGTGSSSSVPAPVTTPGTGSSPSEIVAYVDGVPISNGDLEKAAQGQLQKLQSQIYQVKRKALDHLIDEMVIQKAAKEKGMSSQELLAKEVDAQVEPPTDAQIQAFYDQKKAQIRAPLDQVREKIVAFLNQNIRNEKRKELTSRQRKSADVKILLEPPRTQVALDEAVYTIGSPDAPIVLVEFSDLQCPYSKRSRPAVQKVLDEYKDKVYYVFFDYPLPFHKQAQKGHEAVRCAAEQGKAVAYSQRVFQDPKKMSVKDLKSYAKELKLDMKVFDACLDSGAYAAHVSRSIEKGKSAGVTGTPAFFINGILISGAQPYEAFQSVVEEELGR